MTNKTPICPECNQYLVDINEGLLGLHYDHPVWRYVNPDCEKCGKEVLLKTLREARGKLDEVTDALRNAEDRIEELLEKLEAALALAARRRKND